MQGSDVRVQDDARVEVGRESVGMRELREAEERREEVKLTEVKNAQEMADDWEEYSRKAERRVCDLCGKIKSEHWYKAEEGGINYPFEMGKMNVPYCEGEGEARFIVGE